MNYWLNLFNVRTWEEFKEAGSNVSGFTETRRKFLDIVIPSDVFLCYVTGVMRWVGALEVKGPSKDSRQIWKDSDYPVRFDVKVLVQLTPEYGIPMYDLEGKVSFFLEKSDNRHFKGRIRGSLGNPMISEDGVTILKLLENRQENPIIKPLDFLKIIKK